MGLLGPARPPSSPLYCMELSRSPLVPVLSPSPVLPVNTPLPFLWVTSTPPPSARTSLLYAPSRHLLHPGTVLGGGDASSRPGAQVLQRPPPGRRPHWIILKAVCLSPFSPPPGQQETTCSLDASPHWGACLGEDLSGEDISVTESFLWIFSSL